LLQSRLEIFGALFGGWTIMRYKIHQYHHKNYPNTLETEKEHEYTVKFFPFDQLDLSMYPKDTSRLKNKNGIFISIYGLYSKLKEFPCVYP
jgi:hypothetical protein